VTTWHYTNTSGGTLRVSFPNDRGGQDAVIGPGVKVTFNSHGWADMTVYDAAGGTVIGRGKVREVAQPGD
jgi:hypothetical protein